MDKKRLVIISGVFILITIFIILNLKRGRLSSNLKSPAGYSAYSLLNQAKDLEKKADLLNAKEVYAKLVNEFSGSGDVMNWQKKIEDLNIKLLFSSAITLKSIIYEIKPGDTLARIAKEFKTTADLIMKSNGLTNDKIFPGRKIKVWTAPFNILVDKSDNILLLKSDEEVIKSYIVSTGKNNSTPVGTFKITNKLLNPTWFKAGAVVSPDSAENVLGTRWMGFDLAGYGIHGTTEPQSLGKQVTQGCVRMSNSDVEELYSIISTGIEITIVD